MSERIMQGRIDCGPKGKEMRHIEKEAEEIEGHASEVIRLGAHSEALGAKLQVIMRCAKSIQHWTNFENKCTVCTVACLMLEGMESRNKCIKGLRGEVALLEKTGMQQRNELGDRFLRIKELEAEIAQRSEDGAGER